MELEEGGEVFQLVGYSCEMVSQAVVSLMKKMTVSTYHRA